MKNILLTISSLFLSITINAQTIVSGNVTGEWESGGNPYIVTGDVYVVDSLIIQAGVNVKFQAGGWMIEVGTGDIFLADGTYEDPVVFEPFQGNEPGLWYGILINNSGNNDTLKNCIIKYANTGIYVYYNTTAYINNCTLFKCNTGLIVHAHAIYPHGTANTNALIEKCCFSKNSVTAIRISGESDVYYYDANAFANVINCSIYGSQYGINATEGGNHGYADAKIINSIIVFNTIFGIYNHSGANIGAEDIIYNCFYKNVSANFSGISFPNGFGSNGDYFNFNGDSSDVNFNIYNDPLFVDTTTADLHLQPFSKCIDAGTNIVLGQVIYDPDGTIPDMGANYYPHSNAAILAYSFEEQAGTATIDPVNLKIDIEVVPGTNVTSLVAEFNLSGGATATVNGVEQVSGETANDFTSPVTYKVTSDGGTNVQDWLVTVDIATGIKEIKKESLKVFPNPFDTRTTIYFDNPEHKEYQLTLYDLSGKKALETGKITSSGFVLERGNLKSGVYLMELIGENALISKIVIE